MKKFNSAVSYFLLGLNALLLFLFLFRDKIVVPVWIQPIGRMHPLLLHLPIGFFTLLICFQIFKSQFRPKQFSKLFKLSLSLIAFTLVATALMGLILSREGGYDEDTVSRHMVLGITSSIIVSILYWLQPEKISSSFQVVMNVSFVLLVAASHFGAVLTHGEDYLLSPLKTEEQRIRVTAFDVAVLPVFENRCGSCHNPRKKKGELILIDQEGILKGGENGAVIQPGKPDESEILVRAHLDIAHDDHMPPEGKPQLTETEKRLLEIWISRGCNFSDLWASYQESDTFKIVGNQVLALYVKPTEEKTFDFDFAATEIVEELNTPFRTVSQIAADEPALKANFYLAQYFQQESVEQLSTVKSQLTDISLSGMPIGDDDIKFLASFTNLQNLNLNSTSITDKSIQTLISLPKLKKLSIAGTKVSTDGLEKLADSKTLEEVYAWNVQTSLTEEELQKKYPSIKWNLGFIPDPKEILTLTPPILKNETFLIGKDDKIILKHNLPGTVIRYTLDGTTPDSVSGTVYTEPLTIERHTTIKTIATREGWFKSRELAYNFYKKGIKPLNAELLTKAEKRYKANGSSSLIDEIIGDIDNVRDGHWLGFREGPMEAAFNVAGEMRQLTILYFENTGSYIMPPESVELWGGEDKEHLSLIKKLKPEQPDKNRPRSLKAIEIAWEKDVSYLKLICQPVPKLPAWHNGKGEKGWFMVGEVLFQ